MIMQGRRGRVGGRRSDHRTIVLSLILGTALSVGGPLPASAARSDAPTLLQATVRPSIPPANVTFEVLPVPTTDPPPSPAASTGDPSPSGGNLPVTGSEPLPGWLPALGLILLLAGGVLLVAIRQRRDRRT